MTRDDIIRMAREAGLYMYVNEMTEEPYTLCLVRFANLVAAAEREAVIGICENWAIIKKLKAVQDAARNLVESDPDSAADPEGEAFAAWCGLVAAIDDAENETENATMYFYQRPSANQN